MILEYKHFLSFPNIRFSASVSLQCNMVYISGLSYSQSYLFVDGYFSQE